MTVQLFGAFDLEGAHLKLVSSQKIVALLGMFPGRTWRRDDLAERLWPEAPETAGRDRLRAALPDVRRLLGDALETAKHTVALTEPLSTDLAEARALHRAALIASEETDRETRLERLAAMVEPEFLEGWSDEWIGSERRLWRERWADAMLQVAKLRVQREEFPSACRSLWRLLERDPLDERAWEAYLRASANCGGHLLAARRFDEAKAKIKAQKGARFGAGLVRLAAQVRTGKGELASPVISALEADAVGRTVNRMLQEDPEEALAVFASKSFRQEVFVSPLEATALADRAIAATEGTSENRLQTINYCLLGHSLLNHPATIRERAPWVLEHDPSLARKRSAAGALAHACFQSRDWDDAYRYGRMAISLAEEQGATEGAILARAQLASHRWHQGHFEEAGEVYQQAWDSLAPSRTMLARIGQVEIAMNFGHMLAAEGRYRLSRQWFERYFRFARPLGYAAQDMLALPAYGAVLVRLGDSAGIERLIGGLGLAVSQRDPRSTDIGLEYASLALAHLGQGPKSLALLEQTGDSRSTYNHGRSVAEELVASAVRDLAGPCLPEPSWQGSMSRTQIVMQTIEALTELPHPEPPARATPTR